MRSRSITSISWCRATTACDRAIPKLRSRDDLDRTLSFRRPKLCFVKPNKINAIGATINCRKNQYVLAPTQTRTRPRARTLAQTHTKHQTTHLVNAVNNVQITIKTLTNTRNSALTSLMLLTTCTAPANRTPGLQSA